MIKGLGALLVVLGLAAIIWPVMAGIASVLYISMALVFGGAVELMQAFRSNGVGNKSIWAILGIITIVCGFSLGLHPLIGISFIVAILAGYFIVDGIFRAVAAFFINSDHRIWYAFNGIISLILGYLVLSLLVSKPLSADWVLGTFFGINLIFKGFTIIAFNSKDNSKV
ncbi:MAG: DUF308 domain-containing protein [Negativicutes bacterium]|jgi:uncharacterized membrane protein HdeD (DUF308 family)